MQEHVFKDLSTLFKTYGTANHATFNSTNVDSNIGDQTTEPKSYLRTFDLTISYSNAYCQSDCCPDYHY